MATDAIHFRPAQIEDAAVLAELVDYAGEGLPLTSIGLGTARWGKSILWGLLLGVGCLVDRQPESEVVAWHADDRKESKEDSDESRVAVSKGDPLGHPCPRLRPSRDRRRD